MSKGLFIALSGGMAYQKQVDVVANNVANVNTVGYRADRAIFSVATPDFQAQGREEPPKGSAGYLLANSYAEMYKTYYDQNPGSIAQTGRTLDIALNGNGYFAIQGGNGEVVYTRAGDFRINKDGVLVTPENYPVLGEQGEIKLTTTEVTVDERGQIYSEGALVAKLRIEEFQDINELEKTGKNLMKGQGGQPSPNTVVMQGALEQSNASPMRSMMDLITAQRNFETYTKVTQGIDGIDQKMTSRIKV